MVQKGQVRMYFISHFGIAIHIVQYKRSDHVSIEIIKSSYALSYFYINTYLLRKCSFIKEKLPKYFLADNIHHKENYLRQKVFIYNNNKNKKFLENIFRNWSFY